MTEAVELRLATGADAPELAALDKRCWPRGTYVVPPPSEWTRDPAETTVAILAGHIVGYVLLGHPTPLASNSHVRQVQGIATDPDFRGRGIAELLLRRAIEEARHGGARKLSIRVLSTNPAAQRLYARMGFGQEARLVAEFFLEGEYVDDLILALPLM